MTRKNYNDAVKLINDSNLRERDKFLMVSKFADFFAADNPRFSKIHFFRAIFFGERMK